MNQGVGTEASIEEVSASPSVQLFKERAGTRGRGVLDTERAGRIFGEICRRVDGLPLAIELAAARVAGLDLEDIASHLDDLFNLLPQAARRADGGRRSLRATVEWSDALLTPEERRLLHRMAVFAGPFELTAVKEVCATDAQTAAQIANLTARLVEKSLLLKLGDSGRYQLLETIRQYSIEQLGAANETDAIRERHAMGEIWEARAELDKARAFWERALRLRRELGAIRIGHVHGSMPTALLAVARVAAKQGDLTTASKMLREGLPLAEEMREVGTAQQMTELLRQTSQVEPTQRATLRPAGGVWHIAFNGMSVHVPDFKGFWHLRELVSRPREPVSALSLTAAPSEEPILIGDAAPELYREALRQYRKRLAALDDELDDAEARHDLGRHAKRTVEREALLKEIARATGLGGKPRRTGSPAEKARLNVTVRSATPSATSPAPSRSSPRTWVRRSSPVFPVVTSPGPISPGRPDAPSVRSARSRFVLNEPLGNLERTPD